MSISDTPMPSTARPAKSTTTTTSTSLSVADQEELRKLDLAYKRLRANIPDAPYSITVPCAEPPYQHRSRERAESWCRNTPFGPDEQKLQYMSFLFRDHAETCFVYRTEVDEERDRRAAMKTATSSQNGTPTPLNNVPTKKISLAAYSKNKKASSLSQDSTLGHVQSKTSASVGKIKALAANSGGSQDSVFKGNLSFTSGMSNLDEDEPSSLANESQSPPPPRAKNVPTERNTRSLPPLLSPTLPHFIEAELERRSRQSEPKISTPAKTAKPHQENDSGTGQPAAKRAAGPPNPSHGNPRRLIVKLKYGKKRKQDVERVLKLPSGHKVRQKGQQRLPPADMQPPERARKADASSIKGKINSSTSARLRKAEPPSVPPAKAEKRQRAPDDDDPPPPTKRARPPSNNHMHADLHVKSRTPVLPSSQSPSTATNALQKPRNPFQSRREAKSPSMSRTFSNDSANGVTSTPAELADASNNANGSTSSQDDIHTDARLWSTVSTNFNQLGQRLKHAMDSQSSQNGLGSEDHKRRAVTSVECILSYMAAYHSADYNSHMNGQQPNPKKSWLTLTPLFNYLKTHCRDFPHLEGLLLHLGVVISNHIDRLFNLLSARNAVDKNGLAAGHDWPTIKQRDWNMGDMYAQSRTMLPLEDLISQYPKTWDGRLQAADLVAYSGDWDKPDPVHLKGRYSLPFGPDTPPIQAVRMGISFLNEWIHKEQLEYKLRIVSEGSFS